MNSMIQVCKQCVMDNSSDNTITFSPDGSCNYCSDVLARYSTEYFPNAIGKAQLDSVMAQIKKDGVGCEYDCMVGVSGGLDSTYILYLGYQYSLRMLAVHIDDGFDTEVAKSNIRNICAKTHTELITIVPDLEQYRDLTLAFFKASVPNLAIPQDNLLMAALDEIAKKNRMKYSLMGGNFALESILQRGCTHSAYDLKHIKAIHKRFGNQPISKLQFSSFFNHYIVGKYIFKTKKVYPLNYIDYNLDKVLLELNEFSGYNYYGGKHYESILTRFLQCSYLPKKYGFDKRKSHFSSMIVSKQMQRDEALNRLKSPPYISVELEQQDKLYIAQYFCISLQEFTEILGRPPKQHNDYPVSKLNKFAAIARKFRKYLG